MIRVKIGAVLVLSALLAASVPVAADVTVQQKTLVRFEGMLGKMMNLFGGKSAREGVVQTVVVQGDRKATRTADSVEIVDLAEEKVYQLNLKDKSYRVKTFDQIRKEMEEAAREAEERTRESAKDKDAREMEVEFDLKETGQKKNVNGFDCREVVTTITVHEKGKKLEESGGIVMSAVSWLAPTIAGADEVTDFDVRHAKKLLQGAGVDSRQLGQAFAMFPGMKEAMARFESQKANMKGTSVQTVVTMSSAAGPEQAEAASKQEEGRGGGGGLVGGMLGRFGRKKAPETKDAAKPATPGQSTIMTSTTDVLGISTSANASDLQVPAGFKLKN